MHQYWDGFVLIEWNVGSIPQEGLCLEFASGGVESAIIVEYPFQGSFLLFGEEYLSGMEWSVRGGEFEGLKMVGLVGAVCA